MQSVCVISYTDLGPTCGLGRSLSCISAKLFYILRNIIPTEVPIILEEENKEIVELIHVEKPYFVWNVAYKKK